MLIRAHFPSFIDLSELIPDALFKRCKARKVSVKRMIPIETVAALIGVSEDKLFRHLINSKSFHGVELKDRSILIHPDGAFKFIGKYFQGKMREGAI